MTSRIPQLDGVRGVAVLLVCLIHFSYGMPMPNAFYGWLGGVLNSCWLGVDLFFVLSGFLITRNLLRLPQQNLLKVFLFQRFLRIFPLYFFFIFVLLSLCSLYPALDPGAWLGRHQVFLWFHLSPVLYFLKKGIIGPANHLWSLSIEEVFYIFWSLLFIFFDRKSYKKVLITLIISSFILRLLILAMGRWPFYNYYFAPFRMDTLSLGCLLAVLQDEKDKKSLRLLKCGGRIALFILGIIFLKEGELNKASTLVQSIGYFCIGLCFTNLVSSSIHSDGILKKILTISWLRELGKKAYAIYLFHYLLHVFVFVRWGGFPAFARWVSGPLVVVLGLYFVLMLGGSYAIAFLTWHLLEKHFLKLKRWKPYNLIERSVHL